MITDSDLAADFATIDSLFSKNFRDSQFVQLSKSFLIFARYGEGPRDATVEADHDVIFGPHSSLEISEEDQELLEALGWHLSNEYDCWCFYC